jgi:hypothetical protein
MIRDSFSILLIGVGLYFVLAMFVRKLRPHWKGTKISCGFLGCAGFGLVVVSGGIREFDSDAISHLKYDWFFWISIIGLVIALMGLGLDIRRARRMGAMQSLQSHLISRKRENHDA